MSILEVIRRHERYAAAGEQIAVQHLLHGRMGEAQDYAEQSAMHRHLAYEYGDLLSICAGTVTANI